MACDPTASRASCARAQATETTMLLRVPSQDPVYIKRALADASVRA
ncbi:MAG: hypothetical protein OEO84_00295 [Betaproteobacteria bacterium]|nr:hypothetical protein [Betaproteobacteria bacterium]